jgi:hypothetical protein
LYVQFSFQPLAPDGTVNGGPRWRSEPEPDHTTRPVAGRAAVAGGTAAGGVEIVDLGGPTEACGDGGVGVEFVAVVSDFFVINRAMMEITKTAAMTPPVIQLTRSSSRFG